MGGAGWPGWLVFGAGWPGWLVCLVSLGDVLGPVLVLVVFVLLGCVMEAFLCIKGIELL